MTRNPSFAALAPARAAIAAVSPGGASATGAAVVPSVDDAGALFSRVGR